VVVIQREVAGDIAAILRWAVRVVVIEDVLWKLPASVEVDIGGTKSCVYVAVERDSAGEAHHHISIGNGSRGLGRESSQPALCIGRGCGKLRGVDYPVRLAAELNGGDVLSQRELSTIDDGAECAGLGSSGRLAKVVDR